MSWARTSNNWNNARPTVSTVFGSLGEVEIGVGCLEDHPRTWIRGW